MGRIALATGLDRRLPWFMLVSTGLAALILLGLQQALPMLEGMPPSSFNWGAMAFLALLTLAFLQFLPVSLPFWLAGWVLGWQVMRRARLADTWCAMAGSVFASVAVTAIAWFWRDRDNDARFELAMLPCLLTGGVVASWFVYRSAPLAEMIGAGGKARGGRG